MAQEIPEMPYYIGNGVLPIRSKMIIGGGPKIGKSFIALNIMLALAKGTPLFDAYDKQGKPLFPVSRKCRVLYMEQEIGDIGLQERLRGKDGKPGLLTNEVLEGLDLHIKTRDTALRLDTEEGQKAIYAEVASVMPDVVILDPLAKFHLLDENSAQEMAIVGRVTDHIIEDTGAAPIWIHHTAKPPGEAYATPRTGGDRLRGSSAIFADIDTLMLVDLKSSEKVVEPFLEINWVLRRGAPLEGIMVRRRLDGKITYDPNLKSSHPETLGGKNKSI